MASLTVENYVKTIHEICAQQEPPLAEYGGSHLAACHHPLNTDLPAATAPGAGADPVSGADPVPGAGAAPLPPVAGAEVPPEEA